MTTVQRAYALMIAEAMPPFDVSRRSVQVVDTIKAGREKLLCWRRRARERHQLADLPGHLLRDIGIDPMEAARESRKPFWRP